MRTSRLRNQRPNPQEQAKAALQQARDFNDAVLDTVSALIVVLDREGCIVRFNCACEAATGYTAEEVLGHKLWDFLLLPEERSGVLTVWNTLRSGNFPNAHENHWVAKDGLRRLISWSNTAMRDAHGEVEFVIATGVDITERKRAEQALGKSQETLALAVQAAHLGTWDWDMRSGRLDWSPRCLELFGIAPNTSMTYESFLEALHPDDRGRIDEALRAAIARHEECDVEMRTVWPDGSVHWVTSRGCAYYDDAGEPVRMTGVALDVTDRKREQEALRASEEKFRAAFQGAAVGMGRVSLSDACWMDVNDALCRMVGYSREEMRSTPWPQITHPEDVDVDLIPFRRMAAGELDSYIVEKRFIHKQGHVVWARLTLSLIRDAQGRADHEIAVVEDITEQKRAQEALRQSEEQFRTLANAIPQLCWMARGDGWIFWYNQRWYDYTGKTPEEMQGWGWQSVHDAAELPKVMERWRTSIEQGRHFEMVFPLRGADGVFRPFLTRIVPLKDSSGRVVRWFGTNTDITRQRETEDALRESEERFRAVAENIPQMIWVADPNGDFVYLSPKWMQYTGTTFEQNLTGHWTDSLHPDDRDRTAKAWNDAVANVVLYQAEYRLRRADGEYRWHLARGVPITDPHSGRVLWFGTTTDVQDQKRAHEVLIRSEKLASVGRMAATIAHEINNPLAAAMNSLFIASMNEAIPEDVRENLDLAQKELDRVAHITKQTLGFYREIGNPVPLDVRDILNGVIDLFGPRLRNASIHVRRKYENRARVLAVEGELRQVISNLVANSIDAMSRGGVLSVRTSGPHTCNGDRSMLRVTVADNGSGISPEHLKRVFEPFFTTKQAIGTGLGLWVTSELVRKHEGRVRVRSRLGEGTVFSILLPAEQSHEN